MLYASWTVRDGFAGEDLRSITSLSLVFRGTSLVRATRWAPGQEESGDWDAESLQI